MVNETKNTMRAMMLLVQITASARSDGKIHSSIALLDINANVSDRYSAASSCDKKIRDSSDCWILLPMLLLTTMLLVPSSEL